MTQSELIRLFPAAASIPERVLLIHPDQMHLLKGQSVQECRVFILISQGSVTLRTGTKTTRLEADCFIDMLVWEPIEFIDMSPNLRAWCLLPNYLFTNEALHGLKPADAESFKDRHTVPTLPLNNRETETLHHQLELLYAALNDTEHFYRPLLCRTYFRSFMLEAGNILRHKSQTYEDSEGVETRQDTILRSFLKLVWRYYRTEHNVEFYAAKLCLSSKHLSRVVRQKLGKTPYAVVRDELLQQATTLLAESKMSIQEISAELHFSEQPAFCKFFKKHIGMSPSAYRSRGMRSNS